MGISDPYHCSRRRRPVSEPSPSVGARLLAEGRAPRSLFAETRREGARWLGVCPVDTASSPNFPFHPSPQRLDTPPPYFPFHFRSLPWTSRLRLEKLLEAPVGKPPRATRGGGQSWRGGAWRRRRPRDGDEGHDPATTSQRRRRRRPCDGDGDDGDDPATATARRAATAPPTRSGHRSSCAARCGKVGDGGGGKVGDDVMGGAGDGATGGDGAPDQTCPPPPVRRSLREGWRRRRWGGHGGG